MRVFGSQILPLIALIFAASAVAGPCIDIIEAELWDKSQHQKYASEGVVWNPSMGANLVEQVHATNGELKKQLDRGNFLSVEELQKRGLIEVTDTPAMSLGSNPRPLPFSLVRTPLTYSGFYIPSKIKFSPEIHQGLLILIPGIGTTRSTASGMSPLASTMMKLKHNSNLGDSPKDQRTGSFEMGFRAFGILYEPGLNGVGIDAPDAFGSELGVIVALRHANLILSHMYKTRKTFVGGRSQGGLIADAYRSRFDLDHDPDPGADKKLIAFSISGSPTDLKALQDSVAIGDDGGGDEIFGGDIELVKKAWMTYGIVTHKFDIQAFARAPILMTYSLNDIYSYNPESYLAYIESLRFDTSRRIIEYSDLEPSKAHNHLDQMRDRKTYDKTTELLAEHFRAHL